MNLLRIITWKATDDWVDLVEFKWCWNEEKKKGFSLRFRQAVKGPTNAIKKAESLPACLPILTLQKEITLAVWKAWTFTLLNNKVDWRKGDLFPSTFLKARERNPEKNIVYNINTREISSWWWRKKKYAKAAKKRENLEQV